MNPQSFTIDPARFFLDNSRAVPLVVEHATGLPHFAVVADRLVPFEEWAKEQPKPPPGPVRGFSIRAEDASFRGSLEIS